MLGGFLILVSWGLRAQAPQGFSYQAVVRDAAGQLVLSQPVGLKVSVLVGSATGTAVYSESHSATSNANGLVMIQVGSGTPLTGSFPSIDWLNGPYFLKSELDVTGGTNYTLTSTAQLLSVPFALHATTATAAQSAQSISGPLNELDPVFVASPAGGITATQIASWNSKVGTEVDPVYAASPAGGITATNISTWNNKVGTEVDPTFTASPAGGITSANISSWNNKVGTEVDPTFAVSPAKNITAANITSWNNKVGTEVDPTFVASPASGITSANITSWNNKVGTEVDPTFTASPASGISSANINTWNTDLDRSPTNEIQTLTVGNDSLRISLGNKVALPKGTQWTPWNSGIQYRGVFVDTARNTTTFTNPVRQELYVERANRAGVNLGVLSRFHNADVQRNFYGLATGGNNTAIFTAQSDGALNQARGYQAFVTALPSVNAASNTAYQGLVSGATNVSGVDVNAQDGQFVTGVRSAASSLRPGARVLGMESTVESGDSNVAVVAKALGTTGKRVGLFASTTGSAASDYAAVFQGKTLVKNDFFYLQNDPNFLNGTVYRTAVGQNQMFSGTVPTGNGTAFGVGDFQGNVLNFPVLIEKGARNRFVELKSWNQLHVGGGPTYSMDLLEVSDTSGAPTANSSRSAANFRSYGKRGINHGLIAVSQGISTGENVSAEFWTSDGASGNVGVRSTIWPNTAGDYHNLGVVGITNNNVGASGRGIAGFAYGSGYGLGAWGEAATTNENWGTTGIALAEVGNDFLQIGVNGVARGSYGTGGTGGGMYIGGYFRTYGLASQYGAYGRAFSSSAGSSTGFVVGGIFEAGQLTTPASTGQHIGMRAWSGGAGNVNIGSTGYANGNNNAKYNVGGDFWASGQNATGASYGLQAYTVGTAPEAIGAWLEAAGTQTNYGVYAKASGGTSNTAGYFEGNVTVQGNLNVTGNISKGGGTFKIDHPLDPANKYLVHSFVESPEMLNVYSGNTVTDASGRSTVTLPEYFSAANADLRYQLTVVGATFAQAVVGEEVKGNSFVVLTNQPNVKVSWQITAVRNDAYAKANRIQPEVEKKDGERGAYLHPELFGSDKSVFKAPQRPESMPDRSAPVETPESRE